MEHPEPPPVVFHASSPPLVLPRPSTPPAAGFLVAPPIPPAARVKRKRQVNHVVQGVGPLSTAGARLPPTYGGAISGAGSASVVPAARGRAKSHANGPKKTKATAGRGKAPPPPTQAANVHLAPLNSTGVHNMFEETLESYDSHTVRTSYADMLEENEVNIISAPLDAFDYAMEAEGEEDLATMMM